MDLFPLTRAELQGLPSIYPTLFDVCHFILAAIAVRLTFQKNFTMWSFSEIWLYRKEFGVPFTRTHPFAAWLAHLSASFAGFLWSFFCLSVSSYICFLSWNITLTIPFAGSLVCNPLLGKPVFVTSMIDLQEIYQISMLRWHSLHPTFCIWCAWITQPECWRRKGQSQWGLRASNLKLGP